MKDSIAFRDERNMPVFIHSELDDYGLTPTQFRVYCHIARRAGVDGGSAYPGVDSIAEVCRIRRETVIQSVKQLEIFGLISVTRNAGSCNIYTLNKKSLWKPSTMGGCVSVNGSNQCGLGERGSSERVNGGVKTGERGSSERVNERYSTEGTPLKVPPSKVIQPPSSGSKKNKATKEEVEAFCLENEVPRSDAEWFFYKCEGNGWTNGGKPIKDWKATIRSWKAGGYLPSQKNKDAVKAPNGFGNPTAIRIGLEKELERLVEHRKQYEVQYDFDDTPEKRQKRREIKDRIMQIEGRLGELATLA